METDKKIRVAITHGDTNGVGYELIFKTFADPEMLEMCTPIIYGSPKVAAFHRNLLGIEANFTIINKAEDAQEGKVNMLACVDEEIKVEMGKASDVAGQAAKKALDCALDDYGKGLFDVLVTSPVCDNTFPAQPFTGHTDYIEKKIGNGAKAVKILINDSMRVALLTNNMPLKDIAASITTENIIEKVKTLNNSMKRDFRISNPRVAVLALNPKGGEESLQGREEAEVIIPALQQLEKDGVQAFGPFAADDFFGEGQYRYFDVVLAMYHDQGSAPFRAIAGERRVDYTAGINLVTTAPDHTALYDIAGKGEADPTAFRQAIFTAIDIFRDRNEYDEPLADPLPKLYHEKKEDGEKVRFAIPKKRSQNNENENN